PRVGRAAAQHAEAGESSGGVRAVAEAVEWGGVGDRDGSGRVGVVSVAGEVESALDLGRCRPEQGWVGRRGARRLGRVPGCYRARSAEVGVRVVDAGVDDADLDARAGDSVA